MMRRIFEGSLCEDGSFRIRDVKKTDDLAGRPMIWYENRGDGVKPYAKSNVWCNVLSYDSVWVPWFCSPTEDSWKSYYDQCDAECGDSYHMVFVLFQDSFTGCYSFACFRAQEIASLDRVMKKCGREITGTYINPPVMKRPEGWLYASYESEAAGIRDRIARLTERLIEVGEEMKRLVR